MTRRVDASPATQEAGGPAPALLADAPPARGGAGGSSSPPPPPRNASSQGRGRRSFLKLVAVVGGLLALAPWVPFTKYLSASASGSTTLTKNATIVLDNNKTENGDASGKTVNVNDLKTFPPNTNWIMTYPSSGDPTTDGQNPNTFVKFGLIRLPVELGGANKDVSAFVAFSKVCVHLWCSPLYNPQQCSDPSEHGYLSAPGCAVHEQYECPCHGSTYTVGLDGKPVGLSTSGPASVQPPPTNAIPLLTLTTDQAGNLQVVPPIWDVEHNGVVGYGRFTGNGAFTGGYKPR